MTRYTPQWLQPGTYSASQDRRLIGALWPTAASSGVAVSPSSGMVVNVAAGQVAVPTQNNSGATLCTSDAVEQVTVTAAPGSGTNRIDLIICRPRGNDLDGGANNDFIFDVVTGNPASSPSVPATPAGTVALAQIAIAGGSAAIVAGNITDIRPGGLAVAVPSGPRGTLAQASSTTSSTGTTTNVDWFSAPAFSTNGTRRVRVNFGGQVNAGVANDLITVRLMEGSTVLQSAQVRPTAAGGLGQVTAFGVWQGVPAAGSHTYKLNVALTNGTGPVSGIGGATVPATLIVEDVGT